MTVKRDSFTGQFIRRPVPDGTKWCPDCEQALALDAFALARNRHDGKQPRCKPCAAKLTAAQRKRDPVRYAQNRKRAYVKSRYGLTLEQYDEYMTHACVLCNRHDRKPVLDHDHTTGRVRGTLCNDCNRGIGLLGDDADVCARAAVYLRT